METMAASFQIRDGNFMGWSFSVSKTWYPPISSKIWMFFFGILQRFLHFDVLLENHLNFDGSAIVHFMMDLDLPA